jgi:hypothetical protein
MLCDMGGMALLSRFPASIAAASGAAAESVSG